MSSGDNLMMLDTDSEEETRITSPHTSNFSNWINRNLVITRFKNITSTTGAARPLMWSDFCNMISNVVRTSETVAEYFSMPKERHIEYKDVGCIIAGTLQDDSRASNKDVLSRCMLALDADNAGQNYIALFNSKFNVCYVAHTTHSHTPQLPKWRQYILLSRDVTAEEYALLACFVMDNVNYSLFDRKASKSAKQAMFLPSAAKDGEYLFEVHDGPALDVDATLSKIITACPNTSQLVQAPLALPHSSSLRLIDGELPQHILNDIEDKVNKSSIKTALEYLNPADLSYDNWLAVGMALHNEGFDISVWDEWSRPDSRYNKADLLKKWKSFKSGGGRNGATIVAMAKAAGYDAAKFCKDEKRRLCLEAKEHWKLHEPTPEPFDPLQSPLPPLPSWISDCYPPPPDTIPINTSHFRPELLLEDSFVCRFAEHYGAVVRRVKDKKSSLWYWWTGTVWSEDSAGVKSLIAQFSRQVLNDATEYLKLVVNTAPKDTNDKESDFDPADDAKKYYAFACGRMTNNKYNSALELLTAVPTVWAKPEDFDYNPEILNTPSGILNLRTRKLSPHDRSEFCTHMTKFSPGSQGKDQWDNFLSFLFSSREDVIHYMKCYMGMCLTGYPGFGMLIVHSDGKSGKSVFLDACRIVMGDYAGTINPETLCKNDYGKKDRFGTAAMLGKRYVLASELEQGEQLSIATLKQVFSKDTARLERKGVDGEDITATWGLILETNHLPRVQSNDRGTKRRITVCETDCIITEEIDRGQYWYKDLVEACGPAILQWMVDGAAEWLSNGKKLPYSINIENWSMRYREEFDWLSEFLNTCMTPGSNCKIKVSAFKAYYKQYCKNERLKAVSPSELVRAMEARGLQQSTKDGYKYYVGFEFGTPDHEWA